jgi:predicted O-methyltransferase YrrM
MTDCSEIAAEPDDATPPASPGGSNGTKPPFRCLADKRDRRYVPSYLWGAPTLGDRHRRIRDAVWHIPGWLAEEDALKLYELAYFCDGPILEIGTFCGRSAAVMALALADRGSEVPLVTVDPDASILALAQRSLRSLGVEDRVLLVCDTVDAFLRAAPGFRPELVFVDADHSATGVLADLAALRPCVEPDALLLFHDYVRGDVPDTTGFPVSAEPIEVAAAVDDSWVVEHAKFAGTFGWCGLFAVEAAPES